MADICELLNTDVPRPRVTYLRSWIALGKPCFLGNGARLLLERHRAHDDDTAHLCLRLDTPSHDHNSRVPVFTVLNLAYTAGVRIVPRALEFIDGRPERLLIERTHIDASRMESAA